MDMVSNRIIGGMGLLVMVLVVFVFSSYYAFGVLSSNRLHFYVKTSAFSNTTLESVVRLLEACLH
jgi:hypothetical protein